VQKPQPASKGCGEGSVLERNSSNSARGVTNYYKAERRDEG